MASQFSVWLDDQTAKDLEIISCYAERKRGAMIRMLIRRAARELTRRGAGPNGLVAADDMGQRHKVLSPDCDNRSVHPSPSGDDKVV